MRYQVDSISIFDLAGSRPLFLGPLSPSSLQPRVHVSHHLGSSHTFQEKNPQKNSAAEARLACPGGGKLNKAVKEKFLPLPFHLNL